MGWSAFKTSHMIDAIVTLISTHGLFWVILISHFSIFHMCEARVIVSFWITILFCLFVTILCVMYSTRVLLMEWAFLNLFCCYCCGIFFSLINFCIFVVIYFDFCSNDIYMYIIKWELKYTRRLLFVIQYKWLRVTCFKTILSLRS